MTFDADDGLRMALYTATGIASQRASTCWPVGRPRRKWLRRLRRSTRDLAPADTHRMSTRHYSHTTERTMSPAITTALELNNDLTIPAIGLGVFQSPPERRSPPSRRRCATAIA